MSRPSSDSPIKRKRLETPEPEPSSADTLLPDPVTPISPTKRSRHSSGTLASMSSSRAPTAPLTPPGGQTPRKVTIKQEPGLETPPSAPRTPSNRSLPSGRSSLVAPPSPTPAPRSPNVDSLVIPLRSFDLSAGPSQAFEAPEVAPLTIAVPPERYQIPTGPYQGCTIRQLPKEFRKRISDDENLLASMPALRDALTAWASRWTMKYGRHRGKVLQEVPLYYLNMFVLRDGNHKQLGNEDLYVALKFHFEVRAPEMPGECYVFTFGAHEGKTIESVPSYVAWQKGKGIPTQEGYEDLAEAIETQHQKELADFVLMHPQASTYVLPLEFGYGTIRLAELSEPELRDLCEDRDFGAHTERTLAGDYVYPGMRDAVEYWWLVFECSRWNWRRDRDVDTGEVFGFPPDLESRGLLFPRSDMREKPYVGYARA